jgi:hypothetical protein
MELDNTTTRCQLGGNAPAHLILSTGVANSISSVSSEENRMLKIGFMTLYEYCYSTDTSYRLAKACINKYKMEHREEVKKYGYFDIALLDKALKMYKKPDKWIFLEKFIKRTGVSRNRLYEFKKLRPDLFHPVYDLCWVNPDAIEIIREWETEKDRITTERRREEFKQKMLAGRKAALEASARTGISYWKKNRSPLYVSPEEIQ